VHDWFTSYLIFRSLADGNLGSAPDIAVWGQYGVLGLLCGLLLWFVKGVWARETARSDRLETELLKLHAAIQERHIPALETAARAVVEATSLIRDLQEIRRQREYDAHHNRTHRHGDD
jgi:hypothetical protein